MRSSSSHLDLRSKERNVNFIRVALLVLGLSVSAQAFAEKVAVLSVQQALLASDAAKAFREKLKKELASDQKQVVNLEKQAKALQEKLRKNKDLVSKEEAKKMHLQFQKAFAQYQKQGQALQQKRAQREQQFLKEMRPKLDLVIRSLIETRDYDVVLNRQATVWVNKKIDITKDVIDELNKQ